VTDPTRVRLALAALTGLTTSLVLYPIARVVSMWIAPEPDPALVLWSEHAGFFWRSWMAAYAGGMAAFVGWILAGRDAGRLARALSRAVVVGAALLAAQALFSP
jgi:hypothetical protein